MTTDHARSGAPDSEELAQRYRSIFENATVGIFVLDPQGAYLEANRAAAQIHGYPTAAELVAHRGAPGVFFEQTEDFLNLLDHARSAGLARDWQSRIRRDDGAAIWISQSLRAIRSPAGELLRFEGSLEDVSERKKADETLESANRQLKTALSDLEKNQQQCFQQERMRALAHMASGVAHDFNNVLMPILGFSEILLNRPEILADPTKAVSCLEIIHTGAGDAARTVARLREFYRLREPDETFTPIDLRNLVEQAITLTAAKRDQATQISGKPIRIETLFGEARPLCGNEPELKEALLNLVFNAVEAMPRGGVLTFRTGETSDALELEVSDTGGGMTEEVRSRCLEPFFSTKGVRGAGLGLAKVFGALQRHNGSLEVSSEPGLGASFLLKFPIDRDAPEIASENFQEPKSMTLRILVVDDDTPVREIIAALLLNDDHSVTEARSGQEGIDKARAETFDLVITDMTMPGMRGDQMALMLKALFPRLPIILLTGLNEYSETDVLPGIDLIASKPISMSRLRTAIEKALQAGAA